jgi:hypothetical protein
MQNDRTLQFWDDFHQDNDCKEWIMQPSDEILETIARHCPKTSTDLKILEIGCGTSTMARDLWQHIKKEDENRNVYMLVTDVSPVCIQINEERDEALLTTEYFEKQAPESSLEYFVLNVVDDRPLGEEQKACEVILDKGCLDTFLFRSRQRGENHVYTPIVKKVLDNIWSWMADDDGVYLLISPRSRLRAVRDFAGFASVERHSLSSASKADLVGNEDKSGYIYVCRKNTSYVVGETPAFSADYKDLPPDDTKCQKCGTTFIELRKGEAVEGRGVVFWTRQWKGHCKHCKGPDN